MALRVDPARGQICLVIPKRGSEKVAWRFADENREWIEQHLAELSEPVPFVDGAVVPVFGIDRTIRITRSTTRTTDITLTDDAIEVSTPREDPSKNIRQFLYKLMLDYVTPLSHEKAATIQRRVVSVQLRDTRARWGSCAPDGRIMYCWKLIFSPPLVIDYVVGHECAHLMYMDHSDRFWRVCESLSKDMAYARDWLRKNGDRILCYGIQP